MLVGVVYRHPDNKIQIFNDEFEKRVLERIKNEDKKVIIMGDYNINLMNCESHRHTSNFFDKMVSFNFLPYIIQPTRFNGNSHTLIDNIFYNDISNECISGNLIPHITDHLPNFLFVPHSDNKITQKFKKISKRDFSDFDILRFREDLSNIDFTNKFLQMEDANLMYEFFHKGMNLLFDIHAPFKLLTKNQRRKEKNPWMTNKILNKINIKDALYGQFMKDKDQQIFKEYHEILRELNKDIRKAKFIYLKNKFTQSKNDIKKFWKNINTFLGRNKTNHYPRTMTHQDKTFTDSHQISEAFNKYFSEVAPNLLKKIPKNTTLKHKNYLTRMQYNNSSFFFQRTNRYEVLTHLNNINSNKAKDIYDFPTRIIKGIADLLADPLAIMINNSLSTGVFPELLKHAKVTPLFKSGLRNDIKNYRPISVLPIFDKIFEKIVHERITKF
eukprot:TCONS_00052906-protein